MSIAVYYFTRTGTSEMVAKKIANEKKCGAYKIDDGKNWSGAVGYIKAGLSASMKKSLPISYRPLQEGEEIILVAPLWAGTLPPAVRTFVDTVQRGKITLIVTSMGSTLGDRDDYISVTDVIGKEAARIYGE